MLKCGCGYFSISTCSLFSAYFIATNYDKRMRLLTRVYGSLCTRVELCETEHSIGATDEKMTAVGITFLRPVRKTSSASFRGGGILDFLGCDDCLSVDVLISMPCLGRRNSISAIIEGSICKQQIEFIGNTQGNCCQFHVH